MDLKRLEDKVDKVAEDVTDIKVTMERNTTSLEMHMKRTDDNELAISKIVETLQPVINTMNKAQGAMSMVSMIGKVIIGVATVAGVVFAAVELFTSF